MQCVQREDKEMNGEIKKQNQQIKHTKQTNTVNTHLLEGLTIKIKQACTSPRVEIQPIPQNEIILADYFNDASL